MGDCIRKGIYQHCSQKHVHLYVAEFDFRYNTYEANDIDDSVRAIEALNGLTVVKQKPEKSNEQ